MNPIPVVVLPEVYEFTNSPYSDSSASSPKVGAFGDINIEVCNQYGGAVKVIACIEAPLVVEKVLAHLRGTNPQSVISLLPESWSPPDLFS